MTDRGFMSSQLSESKSEEQRVESTGTLPRLQTATATLLPGLALCTVATCLLYTSDAADE